MSGASERRGSGGGALGDLRHRCSFRTAQHLQHLRLLRAFTRLTRCAGRRALATGQDAAKRAMASYIHLAPLRRRRATRRKQSEPLLPPNCLKAKFNCPPTPAAYRPRFRADGMPACPLAPVPPLAFRHSIASEPPAAPTSVAAPIDRRACWRVRFGLWGPSSAAKHALKRRKAKRHPRSLYCFRPGQLSPGNLDRFCGYPSR